MTRGGKTTTVVAAFGLALALILVRGREARAQVIRGLVRTASRLPIPNTDVRLRAQTGDVLSQTVTGPDGRFELRPLSTGTMHLEASHLGYADWTTADFDLTADSDLDVVISLQFAPIPLEGVDVRARRRFSTRKLEGFERRMEDRAFGGYFLTEEDIAHRPLSPPSHLVLQAPGVTVAGGGGPFDHSQIIAGTCLATIYVDGVRIDQQTTSVDEILDVNRIAGVEIYPRGMSAPPQYQDALSSCGTVVYWTKELEPSRAGHWTTTKILFTWTAAVGMLTLLLTS